MVFRYVYVGCEGSMSDSAIMLVCDLERRWRAQSDKNELRDAFLLADQGFGIQDFILTPVRGVKYHLVRSLPSSKLSLVVQVEWFRGKDRPSKPFELFNLRHSSIRSEIERAFALLKNKFICLRHGIDATSFVMKLIVVSCVLLHNFIIANQTLSEYIDEVYVKNNFAFCFHHTVMLSSTKIVRRER